MGLRIEHNMGAARGVRAESSERAGGSLLERLSREAAENRRRREARYARIRAEERERRELELLTGVRTTREIREARMDELRARAALRRLGVNPDEGRDGDAADEQRGDELPLSDEQMVDALRGLRGDGDGGLPVGPGLRALFEGEDQGAGDDLGADDDTDHERGLPLSDDELTLALRNLRGE